MKKTTFILFTFILINCVKSQEKESIDNYKFNFIDEFSFDTPYPPLTISINNLNLKGKVKSILVRQVNERYNTDVIVRKLYFNQNGTIKEYIYGPRYSTMKYRYTYYDDKSLKNIVISSSSNNEETVQQKIIFKKNRNFQEIKFYRYISYKNEWLLVKHNKIFLENEKPYKKELLTLKKDKWEKIGVSNYIYNSGDTILKQTNFMKNELCFMKTRVKTKNAIIENLKYDNFCTIKDDLTKKINIVNGKVSSKIVETEDNQKYSYNKKNEILSIINTYNDSLYTKFNYEYDSKRNWTKKIAFINVLNGYNDKRKYRNYKITEYRNIEYY
ncbi:hypothetical protein [uncultured Tenacibaculum sp.]|uniref:hypothetical protein n=1 Tax=uncultured Tenacibaculum sp. TaxID=174713 RepID=UPI0026333F15|nr:hypothetical protein [uncultured Tenacibaculum sp.]